MYLQYRHTAPDALGHRRKSRMPACWWLTGEPFQPVQPFQWIRNGLRGNEAIRWKHSDADQFHVCNTCLFGWWLSVCIILYYHLWRTTINVTDSTKVYDNIHPKHFLFSNVGNDSWCCFRPVFENMGIPLIQKSRCATVNWSKAKKHCWLGTPATLLRMILTVAYAMAYAIYSDIPSGILSDIFIIFWNTISDIWFHILSDILCGILCDILSDIEMWHSIWHSIWHILKYYLWHMISHYIWHLMWHSLWYPIWHKIWHPIWHSIWHIHHILKYYLWHLISHSIWHLMWHFLWHPTVSDIKMWHFIWHSIWHILKYYL